LDRAFEHIDKVGAKVKVHGLGVTTVDVMRRFPWYSVDSSTACLAAGMGIAILPRFDHGGQFIFDESPYTLKVGDRILSGTKPRGTREVEAADGSTYFTKGIEEKEGLFDTRADIQMARTTQGHARILSAKRRKMIERYLSQYGYVYDDIYDYAKRIEINVIFMFNLEQSQEVYRNEKVEAYKGLGL
jgi:hypothetical protein